jgi:hypothetical protein
MRKLFRDKRGTVSFEYLLVAASLIAAAAAFISGDTNSLATALGNGLASIASTMSGDQSSISASNTAGSITGSTTGRNGSNSGGEYNNPYWWFHANRGYPDCGTLPTAQERNFCNQGQSQ